MLAKLQFWKLFLDLMVVARFHLKVAFGLHIVEFSQSYLFLPSGGSRTTNAGGAWYRCTPTGNVLQTLI